ncbi:MAG: hypothetical protein JWM11_7464 [Planctomycetaceae bacterium]|nr:hypothetical protein [Planctomycetaceae bacterium]
MVHYSCDLCGRSLSNNRFIVKLEVVPAPGNGDLTEADLDTDHLQQVAELLDELDLSDTVPDLDEFSTQLKQFDLCSECRRTFLKNPLGRGPHRRFKFSGN